VPPAPQLGAPPPEAVVHVSEKSSALELEISAVEVIVISALSVKFVKESILQLHVPIVNGCAPSIFDCVTVWLIAAEAEQSR
jgi:hypothetical protein